ncbi:unnamed protein product [Adineta steineri]|uniref:Immunoglobulin I-set domain-containing protein n=1 Tax=Adineta steineri TaxID=433720 RepID=A0A813RBH8_9BILA|nr:unnamed protein product [Adineta steineri]
MAASAPKFAKPPAIRQSSDVTWFQSETKLTTTSTKYKQIIKVATGNNYDVTLVITELGPNDAGTYKIAVKNKADEITANVNLNFSNEDDAAAAAPAANSAEGTAPTFIQ